LSGRIIEDLLAGAGNETRELLKGNPKKEVLMILHYGKKLVLNTLCNGVVLGEKVFRGGI
jgi:hypothetical protein